MKKRCEWCGKRDPRDVYHADSDGFAVCFACEQMRGKLTWTEYAACNAVAILRRIPEQRRVDALALACKLHLEVNALDALGHDS